MESQPFLCAAVAHLHLEIHGLIKHYDLLPNHAPWCLQRLVHAQQQPTSHYAIVCMLAAPPLIQAAHDLETLPSQSPALIDEIFLAHALPRSVSELYQSLIGHRAIMLAIPFDPAELIGESLL